MSNSKDEHPATGAFKLGRLLAEGGDLGPPEVVELAHVALRELGIA